ncbi:hypothetical protein BZ163_27200 [Pseudomonas sp. VI4.1]|nr:hypothetical protein BZ163_27200 [Pseudomonas sp. VI4.1]
MLSGPLKPQVATPQDKTWRDGKLPEALNKAHAHPQGRRLTRIQKMRQAERQEEIKVLAGKGAEL